MERSKMPESDEWNSAPACGSCVIIFHMIRLNLLATVKTADEIWPPTAAEAIKNLEETRWAALFDIESASRELSSIDLRFVPEFDFAEEDIAQIIKNSRRSAD